MTDAAAEAASDGFPVGEAAFEAFVRARTTALSHRAYLLTGNSHDAEDLVQTALFKAARSWGRIRGDPDAYVRRILYNEAVTGWRHRAARPSERLTATVPDNPDLAPSDVSTRVALRDALARLTPKQRAVLVLRYFEDLSESQTAAVLGVSVGTVKSQTRHALDRLRTLAPELVALR